VGRGGGDGGGDGNNEIGSMLGRTKFSTSSKTRENDHKTTRFPNFFAPPSLANKLKLRIWVLFALKMHSKRRLL